MRLYHNVRCTLGIIRRSFCNCRGPPGAVSIRRRVRHALERSAPVVALESTILTHGMPYPDNVHTALDVEKIISNEGVVPATVGVLHGELVVGLEPEEIHCLGKLGRNARKLAKRDLAVATTQRLSGGTTVSGTMTAAYQSGIEVFVTGGIGGVHRGAEMSMDISSDLTELGRTPVAVVCGGVKSLLDIRLTLEYLETQGVTVATLGKTDDFPAFFTPKSGFKSECSVQSPQECAQLIYNSFRLSSNCGMVITVPIPEELAADGLLVDSAIQKGLVEANSKKITGKEVTPFLLEFVNKQTQGQSLTANKALVKNNAKMGALIAKELASLKHLSKSSHTCTVSETKINVSSCSRANARPVVIGASVVDFFAKADDQILQEGTTPGKVKQSYGGVGRNIAECMARLDTNPLLITAVGNDSIGESLIDHWRNTVQGDCRGIKQLDGYNTASYFGMLHGTGELYAAVGDMAINDAITPSIVERFEDDIQLAAIVCIDGNLSTEMVTYMTDLCYRHNRPVWFEPTCIMKAKTPVKANAWRKLTYISPNFSELQSFCAAIGIKEHSSYSNKLKVAVNYCHQLIDDIPYILVTLGNQGVLVCTNTVSSSKSYLHFPPARSDLLPVHVSTVTGAGDSFAAAMMCGIIRNYPIVTAVKGGLKAAYLSLHTSDAVSLQLRPEDFAEMKINDWAKFDPMDVSGLIDS